MKKLVLSFIFLLSVLPAFSQVFTYGGLQFEVVDYQKRTVETLHGTRIPHADRAGNEVSGHVIIPEHVTFQGKEFTVIGLGYMSFINRPSIVSIQLPTTLRYVKEFAMNNTGVSEIIFPNSVEKIERGVLLGCKNLRSVSFGRNIQSLGDGICKGCDKLFRVSLGDIPYIPAETFYQCKSLSVITIPESVKSIGSDAFRDCTSLSEIIVEGSTVPSLKANSFSSYSASVKFVDAEPYTYKNTVWDNFFNKQNSARQNNMGFDSDDSYDGTFDIKYQGINYKIDSQVAMTLSVVGATSASGTVKIPETVNLPSGEYTVMSIGNSAFKGNEKISAIVLPNTIMSIGNSAFKNCKKLSYVTMSRTLESIGNSAFEGCKKLERISFPASLKIIGSAAFRFCEKLSALQIPNSVYNIGNAAFSECKKLTNVTLPNSLTSIESGLFNGCKSLTSIRIPEYVTNIGNNAFYNCDHLEFVNMPFALKFIGDNAFFNCQKLKRVNLENLEAWCNMGLGNDWSNPFYYGPDLYVDGNDVRILEIPYGVSVIGEGVFKGCGGFTSLVLPDSLTEIKSEAFANCRALLNLTIPGSVSYIGKGAFENCTLLNTVSVPQQFIAPPQYNEIFSRCYNIKNVLPSF